MSLDASGEVARAQASAGLSTALYEETQFFAPWVYILVILGIAVQCVGTTIALNAASDDSQTSAGIIAVIAAIACLVLNMLVLRTRVDAHELYVCLGWIPCFWTRISLAEIDEARIATYRPLRDAGGWGMRFGRFEGEPCRYWNARGKEGVFIITSKQRYMIGSQRREELYRVLSRSTKNGNLRP